MNLPLPFSLSLEKTDFMGPCLAFHAALFLDLTAEESSSEEEERVGERRRRRLRMTWDANGSIMSEGKVGRSS